MRRADTCSSYGPTDPSSCLPGRSSSFPSASACSSVAGNEGAAFWEDVTVDGTHIRVFTFAYGPGAAVQVARPLNEVDESLRRIGLFLLLIAAGGVVIAAGLGLVVARAALTPVRELTETVERVSETQDLSERIEVAGNDELSRLAASFNGMLGALEESTRAQRQLVADASHELRTPLTSVRTNIEVLAGDRMLPPEDRARLLSDVVEQLGEMTTLISELIELARAEQMTVEPEDVRLDLLVADAVERARRNRPEVAYSVELEPAVVQGVPATIERAVGNLLDNAAKWSPRRRRGRGRRSATGGSRCETTALASPDEDLPYVFDRFYRARGARGMPGIRARAGDRSSGGRVARRRRGRRACRGRWHAHGAHARRRPGPGVGFLATLVLARASSRTPRIFLAPLSALS